jgi:hypothetical protein
MEILVKHWTKYSQFFYVHVNLTQFINALVMKDALYSRTKDIE